MFLLSAESVPWMLTHVDDALPSFLSFLSLRDARFPVPVQNFGMKPSSTWFLMAGNENKRLRSLQKVLRLNNHDNQAFADRLPAAIFLLWWTSGAVETSSIMTVSDKPAVTAAKPPPPSYYTNRTSPSTKSEGWQQGGEERRKERRWIWWELTPTFEKGTTGSKWMGTNWVGLF